MVLAPGTRLGPYEILSPIGAGGMGEVWKARDTRLGRIVAIKTVKEQHNERFKQEARSIAALNHPNICQLFDIGDDYLVLEYVEGKPLSSPLSESEAVRISIQIAAALEAAHKKGIIHRDLKPGNIMVTSEGSVKLLDFGLAKLYEQKATESTADLPPTQAGAVLGTVAYMSPEQAQGQPADARSDIFSLGLVFYEMLSGKRAFSGDSNPAILAALLRDEPAPLQVSSSVEKVVWRCLAKQPSGRYQTTSEVKAALEQIIAGKPPAAVAEAQPSIAVLPFVNMSGDKEQEYFSDGLAEEIINALTQIPGLKVIARTSAFAFKDKREDITKIAEALRVSNILEGSVRKAGNRIRITAQLITAADGSHLWSERYDREMTDVFAIQDEISQTIAEKLRVYLSGARRLIKHYTANAEAYNLYLKGHYHINKFAPENMEKAKEYFEQAITLDPNYARAWFGLADFHHRMGLSGFMPPAAANVQSRQAVMKALQLDDTLPEAHAMMAVLLADDYDWQGSEREFRWALELDPSSQDVELFYFAYYLLPMRRLDEAEPMLRKMLERDPLSSFLQAILGGCYLSMHLGYKAIEHFQNALELDPDNFMAHRLLAPTYIWMGKIDEGIRACETATLLFKRHPMSLGDLASAYALIGKVDQAREILKELQEFARKCYVSPTAFGMIYYGLGEMDTAFDWFDKAAEEHTAQLLLIHSGSPMLDRMRSHPRYRALLRKMNLEP